MSRKVYSGGSLYKTSGSNITPDPHSGYDVIASRIDNKRRERALERANAIIHNGHHYVRFFCPEVTTEFGLEGSTGQGRFVRDFYPHNIIIPPLQVHGECLNQEEYATIAEFIRDGQRKGVVNGNLLQVEVKAGGLDVPTQSSRRKSRPIMKGVHLPLVAQGYIKAMARKHEKFVYKPEFTFEFVLVEMLSGLYHEQTAEAKESLTMIQILKSLEEATPAPQVAREAVQKVDEKVAGPIIEGLEGLF